MSPTPPITPLMIVRRAFAWSLICGVSALPSFVFGAMNEADRLGMVAGVLIFVLIYTAVTCTQRFERIYRKPFVRSTMYVGYGLRLVMVASLLGVAAQEPLPMMIFGMPDLFCGVFAMTISGAVIQVGPWASTDLIGGFVGALVVTCVQGVLLNIVVFAVMGIVYAGQRLFRQMPPDAVRGFEVVPVVVLPVEATSTDARGEAS